ncbi:MAG: PEP-CTERM sorting domain-containing protein [Methyloprofundus sp.]|nr:PEP-CTERM sorting domain-containing protein [Methyloprofundus sp.]
MNIKTKIVSAIALTLASAMIMSTAQADPIASAQSILTLENFKVSWTGIVDGNGAEIQVDRGDFSTFSVTSSQLTAANLTGMTGVSSNPSSSNGTSLVAESTRGTVDPAIFSIPGATTTTVFRVTDNSAGMVGNFSASASNDTGAPISGFPDSNSPVTANADLHNASYASLDTLEGSAGTSSSSTLASTFTFTSLVSGSMTFTFDVGAYIDAFLSAGAAQSAVASWNVGFTLIDTTTNTIAGFFNAGDSISNNLPGSGINEVGALNSTLNGLGEVNTVTNSFITQNLVAGNIYQLTAVQGTRTQVERVAVPEPSLLALLGIGLVGMAGVTSRKAKNASFVTYA